MTQTYDPKAIHRYGSKERELDRTAEMIVDLHKRGHIARAIWLIHDGNRFDAGAMKFLAERVEAWSKDPNPRVMRTWIFPMKPGFTLEVTAASREDAIARAVEKLNTHNPPEPVLKE
jgi:hypothetical protein